MYDHWWQRIARITSIGIHLSCLHLQRTRFREKMALLLQKTGGAAAFSEVHPMPKWEKEGWHEAYEREERKEIFYC